MVNRTSPIIKSEIEKLNEKETLAVVNYISQIISNRLSKQSEPQPNDDLIVSLSERRENQRARQVFEWEKIRRHHNHRAA